MAAHLFTNPPAVVNFLNVNFSTAMYLKGKLVNSGDAPLTISNIVFAGTIAGVFYVDAPNLVGLLPLVLAPGASQTFVFVYNPTAGGSALAAHHGTMTITHNGDNSPYVIDLYGNSVVDGTPSLDLNPSSWFADDGAFITMFTYGAELNVEVSNTSSVPVVFQDIQFVPPFYMGSNRPSLPITIPPFGRVSFGVVFYPNAAGTVTQTAVNVLTDIGLFVFTMSGTGVGITSYKTLNGTPSVLIGVGAKVMSINPASMNCEEASLLSRAYAFGGMFIEKALKQVGLRHEDEGQLNVQITATTRLATSGPTNIPLGSAGAGHWEMFSAAPFHVEGEVINLRVDRTASAGTVIIDEIDITVDEWDEMNTVDLVNLLPAVVSYKSITGTAAVLVGVGTKLMTLNPASFDTEEAGFFETLDNFGDENVEKTVEQTIFKYEDKGLASVVITLSTRRETKTPVTLILGNASPTGDLLSAFADSVITDEYINIRLDRAAFAGPVDITDFIPRIEGQGEIRAGS